MGSCMLSTGLKSAEYGSGVSSDSSAATALLHTEGVAANTSSGFASSVTSQSGHRDLSCPWNGSETSTSQNAPTVDRIVDSNARSPVAENGALGARKSCSFATLLVRSSELNVGRSSEGIWLSDGNSGLQSSAGMAAVSC